MVFRIAGGAFLLAVATGTLVPACVAGQDTLRGDSRRPGVEVPSTGLPPSTEFERSPTSGSPLRGQGDRPYRGQTERFSGELEYPTGDHVTRDLDEQGAFRPGDLKPGSQEPADR